MAEGKDDKAGEVPVATNRKAHPEYLTEQTVEAGHVPLAPEVKALAAETGSATASGT